MTRAKQMSNLQLSLFDADQEHSEDTQTVSFWIPQISYSGDTDWVDSAPTFFKTRKEAEEFNKSLTGALKSDSPRYRVVQRTISDTYHYQKECRKHSVIIPLKVKCKECDCS